MKIQVDTDTNIAGDDAFITRVGDEISAVLGHLVAGITQIEVHLTTERSESSGKAKPLDKRCLIEAQPTGQTPVTVTDHADTIDAAYLGAAHKLVHLLVSRTGRLRDIGADASIRHLEQI